MIEFILNNDDVTTNLPTGTTVLDFVRYRQNLKGTKIGCREGDCGACTILVGELVGEDVEYRTMTSCLMPLANAAGKHIVTIEGINPADGSLTPVQQAMVDESGTQCGFCTVGFVVSLTGFCIDKVAKTPDNAISAVDGNICRCTGYKSIERAALRLTDAPDGAEALTSSIERKIVPNYFRGVSARLRSLQIQNPQENVENIGTFVGGGTDVYVQKAELMAETVSRPLLYDDELRGIRDAGEYIEIGASATVTDLLDSPVMLAIFKVNLYKHLKLISSTPIRNMATLAGNFVNASPIGDMTVWFLALNAEVVLSSGREMLLSSMYLDYKKLAKNEDEFIKTIRFRKPGGDLYFNFEKVCKRTYLDIATVNTAISLTCDQEPGIGWLPPVLSEPGSRATERSGNLVDHIITDAHLAAGGVAPIPLYLKETSSFLIGRTVNQETIEKANEIMQLEISPISDVRGTEQYKRLLLRQLFRAHFVELFGE